MTDQPNPYSQPKESSGVPIGEAKKPQGPGRLLALLCISMVVPFALIGLLGIALFIYVVLQDFMG